MKIKVLVKWSYGKPLMYPDCDISKAFTELTGTKTLTTEHLKTIKSMGYEIDIEHHKSVELLALA